MAAEVRHAKAQAEAQASWRRELRRLAVQCGAVYVPGVFLAFSSLHLTGDYAQMALWGGLLIGNGAILVFWLTLWAREAL